MYEYAEDFASYHAEFPDGKPRNLVSVRSHLLDPAQPGATVDERSNPLGGLTLQVRAGFKSDVQVEPFTEDSTELFVQAKRPDGTEITSGPIWVRVEYMDGSVNHYSGFAEPGGTSIPVQLTDWAEVKVQYLGTHPHVWSEEKTFTP